MAVCATVPEGWTVLHSWEMTPADAPVMEKAQFEALLKPNLEVAYRYAYRLVGNADEAMDLVQDASVQAFRARHTFQLGSNFRAWFLKILTNLFYQQRQKKRVETV